jgi:2'-5' RNA ligase
MSVATGYSLWLVPERSSKVRETLFEGIFSIARATRTVPFQPHLTLLGGLEGPEREVLRGAHNLAQRAKPFEVPLGGVGANGIFFQALFLSVPKPSPELTQLHGEACKVFGHKNGVAYFPHVSLAYGNLDGGVVSNLKRRVSCGKFGSLEGTTFPVREIHVVRTEGSVEQWMLVEGFPLGL